MERVKDRRVIKTKKAIRNAIIKILFDTSIQIEEIDVAEVCRIADINRKTFYNHYKNVPDVLEDLNDMLIETFLKDLDYNLQKFPSSGRLQFNNLLNHIKTYLEPFNMMLSRSESLGLFSKIFKRLNEETISHVKGKTNLSADAIEFRFYFIFGGIIASLFAWFNSDRTVDLEEMFNRINTATSACLNGIHQYSKNKTTEQIPITG